MNDRLKIAKEILDKAPYMVLSTSDVNANPWVVPVQLQYAKGEISWQSFPDTQHSLHVEGNKYVAFLIDQSSERRALYGRAHITAVTPREDDRWVYRAKVSELWLKTEEKDASGNFVPRQPIEPESLG